MITARIRSGATRFASLVGVSACRVGGREGARILVLAVLLGACAPEAARTQAAPGQIDTTRLLRHVQVLAADSMRGRATGSEGAAKARRYLLGELARMGLERMGGAYEHPFTLPARSGPAATGVNLVSRVRGTGGTGRAIVVTAHYDHVGVGEPTRGDSIYNGADDNATGVAALLELADWFQRNPPATTLVFALLDAEEMGLLGARAFLATPTVPRDSILLNVNLDMVGNSAAGELYVAGTFQTPALRPVLEPVAAGVPVRLLFGHDRPIPTAADDWTSQSDHGAFHSAGIPFLYFGVEDHPDYHQPSDDYDSLTHGFFAQAVETVLEALKAVDANAGILARSAR